MTQFVVDVDQNAAAAQEEAKSSGGGSFLPLPGGPFQVFIEKVKGIKPFGGNGGNANKKVLELQVKVVSESPTGANRVYFPRVPLFTRYAPTDKNPDGAPAKAYFDFFEKFVGISAADVAAGKVGDIESIGGMRGTAILSAPKPPDNYNPLGFNEIAFWDAVRDIDTTPVHKLVVPWLDDNGNLTGQWANGVAAKPGVPVTSPAGPPPVPAYGAAATAPTPPPVPGYSPVAAATPPTPPQAWAPSAADVQAAVNAGASSGGY